MKRLIFLLLALFVAGSANAATKVQVMTGGKIDIGYLPTLTFFQESDPAIPELGQIWWNNSTAQLKIAGALGVYAFNSTSLVEWDTTPEAFSFTDITDATTDTVYTSDPITVSGINWPAAISVSGDASAKYSINNATAVSTNGTVESGDEVRAVVTSSASAGTAVNATVTIGGVSDAYAVTTDANANDDITFFWTAESLAFGASDYSAFGATTFTAESGAVISAAAKKVGTYGLNILGSYDNVAASDQTGVFNTQSGRFGTYVRFQSLVDGGSIVEYGNTGSALFKIAVVDSDKLAFMWGGSEITRTSVGVSTDVWYFIEASWNIDDGVRKLYIDGYSVAENTDSFEAIAPTQKYLRFGNKTNVNCVFNLDSIMFSSDSNRSLHEFRNLELSPR